MKSTWNESVKTAHGLNVTGLATAITVRFTSLVDIATSMSMLSIKQVMILVINSENRKTELSAKGVKNSNHLNNYSVVFDCWETNI